jgi:ABC-type lipoprotein export system ATPase subunit
MQSKEAYLTTTTFRRSSDTPREESPSHPRHQNLHKKHHHHHHHHHRNSDKPVDYQLQSGSAEVTDEATAFEANGPTEVMKEESSLRPTGLFIPAMGDEDHGVTSTTRDSQGKTTVSTSSTANDIETSAPAADNNRQGKLLEWTDISMVVMGNKKKQERVILDHVSGQARPGETTAILGASGAGKTSLFHVLAGRIQHKSHLRIHGHVYLSHQIIDPSQRQVRLLFAYVAQHDTLHESSTPQEALAFSAKLRSGSTEKIDSLIHELGLESVANTKISSLSGGERRRTSIGVELVSNPSIL